MAELKTVKRTKYPNPINLRAPESRLLRITRKSERKDLKDLERQEYEVFAKRSAQMIPVRVMLEASDLGMSLGTVQQTFEAPDTLMTQNRSVISSVSWKMMGCLHRIPFYPRLHHLLINLWITATGRQFCILY